MCPVSVTAPCAPPRAAVETRRFRLHAASARKRRIITGRTSDREADGEGTTHGDVASVRRATRRGGTIPAARKLRRHAKDDVAGNETVGGGRVSELSRTVQPPADHRAVAGATTGVL